MTLWVPAGPTCLTPGLPSPGVPEVKGGVKTAAEQKQSYCQAPPDPESEQGHCSSRTWPPRSSHHFSRGFWCRCCESTSAARGV